MQLIDPGGGMVGGSGPRRYEPSMDLQSVECGFCGVALGLTEACRMVRERCDNARTSERWSSDKQRSCRWR